MSYCMPYLRVVRQYGRVQAVLLPHPLAPLVVPLHAGRQLRSPGGCTGPFAPGFSAPAGQHQRRGKETISMLWRHHLRTRTRTRQHGPPRAWLPDFFGAYRQQRTRMSACALVRGHPLRQGHREAFPLH